MENQRNTLLKSPIVRMALIIAGLLACTSCGGGSGGSDDGGSFGDSGGTLWEAQAVVTKDGCGERISPVRQVFSVDDDSVNTGIADVPLEKTDLGFSFGFDESNGDCVRTYLGEFSNVQGSSADVVFTSTSVCSGVSCQNQWAGTASRVLE